MNRHKIKYWLIDCLGTGFVDGVEKWLIIIWEEFWNVHLLMMGAGCCPGVTLCGWQGVQIQLLTNMCRAACDPGSCLSRSVDRYLPPCLSCLNSQPIKLTLSGSFPFCIALRWRVFGCMHIIYKIRVYKQGVVCELFTHSATSKLHSVTTVCQRHMSRLYWRLCSCLE